MIVHRQPPHLRLVTQQDHAAFAAELLSLWRADGLPRHPHREILIAAVREHDNGWRENDAAPQVDRASGQPLDFLALSRTQRHELWERGSARHAETRPAVAALITEHARQLLAEPQPDEARRELLDELAERRDELLERALMSAAELDELYPWLRLADSLSLLVCGGWDQPFESAGRRAWRDGDTLRLEPFPLAGATRFAVACRCIPDRRYDSDAELGVALVSAHWERLAVRVAPAGEE